MKSWVATIAGAGVGLACTAWIWSAAASPTVVHRVQRPVPQTAQHPEQSTPGRVYLSNAQVRQAIASGTFDRPVKSLLSVDSTMQFGDFVWNDRSVPAGPTWIRVDLKSQLISVFRAGHEIGTAVIVYGGDNKRTPTGTLHILGKARVHRSSLYDAAMPYTLRLTGDGVSIHGSSVRWGAATHGCIGVPLGFARRLFDTAHVGDDVVVVPGRADKRAQRRS